VIDFKENVQEVKLIDGEKGKWQIVISGQNKLVFQCRHASDAKEWVKECQNVLHDNLGAGILQMDSNVCYRSEVDRLPGTTTTQQLALEEVFHRRQLLDGFRDDASSGKFKESMEKQPVWRKCLQHDIADSPASQRYFFCDKRAALFSPSNPKQVRVRLKVNQISCVDIVKQQFVIDFQMEASWTDYGLKGRHIYTQQAASHNPPNLGVTQQTAQLITSANGWDRQHHWTPQLKFQDMDAFDRKEEWYHVYDDHPDNPDKAPIICYRVAGQGRFNERFELQNFPFDTQDLHIRIKSSTHLQEWPCVRLSQNSNPKVMQVACSHTMNAFVGQTYFGS
jgi:hypothetical protein